LTFFRMRDCQGVFRTVWETLTLDFLKFFFLGRIRHLWDRDVFTFSCIFCFRHTPPNGIPVSGHEPFPVRARPVPFAQLSVPFHEAYGQLHPPRFRGIPFGSTAQRENPNLHIVGLMRFLPPLGQVRGNFAPFSSFHLQLKIVKALRLR